MSARAAIVLSSFVVHPDMPSEPGIGWQFLLSTLDHAKATDTVVVLITNRRSEIACRGRIPAEFVDLIELIAIDIPRSPMFFRWHEPRFTRIEHEIWVRLAGRKMRGLARRFDIVYAHHVVFATELLSTPITRLPDHVFKVWGPIGAGGVASVFLISPRSVRSVVEFLKQTLRDLLVAWPARRTARRCDLVLAQNDAAARVVGPAGTPSRLFPNVVVPHAPVDSDSDSGARPGLHILCVGHLIARKRLDVAIDTMLDPLLSGATLHIVGQTTTAHAVSLRTRCAQSGLTDRVVFHGGLDHADALDMMRWASVLFHPSGREGASGVVGEATSRGLPVVCFEGTGAASVLHYSGGSGVAVRARAATSRSELAGVIVEATQMPRTVSDVWSSARFVELATELRRDGLRHRTGRAGVLT